VSPPTKPPASPPSPSRTPARGNTRDDAADRVPRQQRRVLLRQPILGPKRDLAVETIGGPAEWLTV
jgi:hypothetical protein